ncbi:MAG: CDP-glycerol glycerophosphotransferase family protein [Phycisphaerales bacterium]|nr:CDP-glycerol glycerophosphotransferase family protein [Phycisphaerales bacterium]
MSRLRSVRVLFTGYAPVHFACFRPLFERLLRMEAVEVRLSGGLRSGSGNSITYDEQGMYGPFGIAPGLIIPTVELDRWRCDVLFAGNTNMIAPAEVGRRVQIFHGISFRNKAVRADNMGADHYFMVGPYMKRRFVESGLMNPDDPRALEIGFMKTDRLLNGALDRDRLLAQYGLDGSRPIVLYAPTGQKYNSLETMGEAVIAEIAASDGFDLIVKPHDHPKNADINWFERLAPQCGPHVRVTREVDVIPLLFLADVLITDASSVSSEYSLLDRPILFLDVPRLIKRAVRGAGSQIDLETWGRHAGPVIAEPAKVVEALRQALGNPSEFSAQRRAMANDLFFNPGCATDHAAEWFRQVVLNGDASQRGRSNGLQTEQTGFKLPLPGVPCGEYPQGTGRPAASAGN